MADAINIPELHEELLQVLLSHREKNPRFSFVLRKINLKGRLDNGYWFLGDDKYIAISPYNIHDQNNRTPAIYFGAKRLHTNGRARTYMLVIPQEEHRNFYLRIANEILGMKIEENKKEYEKVMSEPGATLSDIKEALIKFLEEDVPTINAIAKEEGISDDFLFINPADLDSRLRRIDEIKNRPAPQSDLQVASESTSEDDSAQSWKTQIKGPLNVIFYGPPGTGKTYKTAQRALEIIKGEDLSGADRKDMLKHFDAFRSAGQIEMITFHQNFSYEDFIEGIKPQLEDDASEGILYELKEGTFKEISDRANENRESSELEGDREVDVDLLSDEYASFIEEELAKLQDRGVMFFDRGGSKREIIEVRRDSRGKFLYFQLNGSAAARLRHTNIERHYGNYERNVIRVASDIHQANNQGKPLHDAHLYFELFQRMKKFKAKKEEIFARKKQERKNYVLIIDEINRGNIAKIFGELITLIEPSKRLGQEEALRVKLPYSQKEFGVPDNLYIIGTMNTADRSLTLLDTALRRRFDFEEMMPDPELCPDNIEGIDCEELLRTINARIKSEHEYGREHQIGHSYFMGKMEGVEDVKRTFQRNILPLLQEYFFDDWEKIANVLKGSGFVQKVGEGNSQALEWLPYDDEAWDDADNYIAIYGSNSGGGSE